MAQPVIVGFTGTQRGMSAAQLRRVMRLLGANRGIGARTFLHGLCVGADEEAARVARAFGYVVVGYPGRPQGDPKRSTFECDIVVDRGWGELRRNRVIAEACGLLIAAPWQNDEVRRSGTWATVRYAEAAGKAVVVVRRDGSTRSRGWEAV